MQDANAEATKKKHQQNSCYLLVLVVNETAGCLSRNSLHFRTALEPFSLLPSSVHGSNRGGTFSAPPLPRLGVPPQGTDPGLCQGPGRGSVSVSRSLAKKAKARRESGQLPQGACRCGAHGLGSHREAEPPSAVCWQTQLHPSISCYTYAAATASEHFCETPGTAHTPSF